MAPSDKRVVLTVREKQVMVHVLGGKSIKEIAVELNLSARVVKFHVDNILEKHGVHSRMELLARQLAGDPNGESAE